MITRKRFRKLLLVGFASAALVAVGALALNEWIVRSTRSVVFTEVSALPQNGVGLVLGTGKLLRGSGRVNPHFRNRVKAAAALYHAGKVRHLLLSGDNHVAGYDEPTDMAEALMELNVPPSAMTLDYGDSARWIRWCVPGRCLAKPRSPLLRTTSTRPGPSSWHAMRDSMQWLSVPRRFPPDSPPAPGFAKSAPA